MSARSRSRDTAHRILDVAERLAQMRGFNGFSYADIATELAVTKASLHYHFATKADLGRALIARYHDVFVAALAEIDASAASAGEKLERYIGLYRAVLADDRMCLCGMVAAEHATLPKPMQEEIRRFFTANETWLAAMIELGKSSGELRLRGTSLDVARLLLGALQGAMLVARSYRSVERFDVSAKQLLADLGVTSRPPPETPRPPRPRARSPSPKSRPASPAPRRVTQAR